MMRYLGFDASQARFVFTICHFYILWPSHISQDLNCLSCTLNYSEVKELLLSEYLCACPLFSGLILIFCLYY